MVSKHWPLFRSAAYLTGRGVTFGPPVLSQRATNPGKYSISIDVASGSRAAGVDEKLDIFADESLDHVLVTQRLESVYEPQKLLREAAKKLKKNGHLVVWTKVGNQTPGVHEFYPATIEKMVGEVGRWGRKASYEQDGVSVLIFKKLSGSRGIVEHSRLQKTKRACVVRYGAIGDGIILSPLLRKLKEDGYEVTLNVTPYCYPSLENSPFVDNVLIQEREVIPNELLGPYWDTWKGEYEKYVNLSESLEGGLLKVEGRMEFFTSKEWRHRTCDVNYFDRTMELGGYPEEKGKCGEMFFTAKEEQLMKDFFAKLAGKFVILWALQGSSCHKIYPLTEPVLVDWLAKHPDARVITVGDDAARLLEFEHPQVICKAGVWKIRESLLATKYASLVVGPETAVTNAAGCYPTPKIVLLSHSTKENLTKYWENDFSLEPNVALAPCYPCHALHYSKESCPQGRLINDETGETLCEGPLCAMGAIEAERLMKTMDTVYETFHRKLQTALD